MNSLDSRYLRLGDTFAHRFTHPGRYLYGVSAPGGIAPPGHHAGFEIVVAAEKGASSQTHYVTVAWANGAFSIDPATLHIKNNDVILWSTASPVTPGFAVQGRSSDAHFDSAEMPANSMYSHAFGVIGEIAWSGAADPKIGGFITVTAPPAIHTNEHRMGYMKTLSEASIVMIDAPKVHPKRLKVVLGQTVFFAVRSGHGISIVDKVLLSALNPQPLPPGPPERQAKPASTH
jgi:plastocyanin